MKHENIEDKYYKHVRENYCIPIKYAVYVGIGGYFVGLILFAVFMLFVLKPMISPPRETNEERNEAMFQKQREQSEVGLPEWRPDPILQ